jgi:hypothetical protein
MRCTITPPLVPGSSARLARTWFKLRRNNLECHNSRTDPFKKAAFGNEGRFSIKKSRHGSEMGFLTVLDRRPPRRRNNAGQTNQIQPTRTAFGNGGRFFAETTRFGLPRFSKTMRPDEVAARRE